jgi:hypothetical protein
MELDAFWLQLYHAGVSVVRFFIKLFTTESLRIHRDSEKISGDYSM